MDAQQVREAVDLISAACERVLELRQRRIGNRTCRELRDDLEALNRNIAARDDNRGPLLAQKALWLNHDHVLNELGNMQAILQAIKRLADDEGVRATIAQEGFSLDATLARVAQGQEGVKQFREAVLAHEEALAGGLAGQRVGSTGLEGIENILLSFDAWENKVAMLGKSAVERIRPAYGRIERGQQSFVCRVAAALVLSIASAAVGNDLPGYS